MKKFSLALLFYAGIPFLSSLIGSVAGLFGIPSWAFLVIVPGIAALLYVLLHKTLNMKFAALVNGGVFLVLLVCFTVLMAAASGNISGTTVSCFTGFILPFFPAVLILTLMGANDILYLTALLTYAAAFGVCALYSGEKINYKKLAAPAVLLAVCLWVSATMYINRPEVRYSGHGFEYMHGYSSTDFTDYTVYSNNSKLVTLDHEPSLMIENEVDMPVLDGAEACYPLYAAIAKAVYKDIDTIENEWPERDTSYQNGKIVTFTNTVLGFERLLFGSADEEKFGGGVDMFFGARPSADQLAMAKELSVEPEITPIGREAFVFFAEEDNPVDTLTSQQIKAIYSGDITNWKEVGGPDQKIIAFQRPHNSGSQTMMEYFMGDVSLKEPKTYETVSSMVGVIHHVAQYANENGALGYSFRYFLEELNQEKGVKLLAVDGVYPSIENIDNGTYPLTADLCLITRKGDDNPYVQKMIDFILSEDGQYIIRQTGYAGLPAAQ